MQPHLRHRVVLPSVSSGFIFIFLSVELFVMVSSSNMVYFSSLTIKMGIMPIRGATLMYLIGICLVIFHIDNNIYFILNHDGWSVGGQSVRRLCIIFRNSPDMEDSVNSLIAALTTLSFSRMKLALFNALKTSRGSGKRIFQSFN